MTPGPWFSWREKDEGGEGQREQFDGMNRNSLRYKPLESHHSHNNDLLGSANP